MAKGAAQTQAPARKAASQRWLQFGFGAFLLALAGLMGWHLRSRVELFHELARSGRITEAVVTGYEVTHGRRDTFYYPVLQFATAEGQPARATSYTPVDPSDLPRGTRLKIVHAAADPSRAMPAEALASGPGLTAWALGVMAVMCLAVGATALWLGFREGAS